MDDPCTQPIVECRIKDVPLCLVFLGIIIVLLWRYGRVSIDVDLVIKGSISTIFLSMLTAVLPTSLGTIITARFKKGDKFTQVAEPRKRYRLRFNWNTPLESDDEDDDDFGDTDEEFLAN